MRDDDDEKAVREVYPDACMNIATSVDLEDDVFIIRRSPGGTAITTGSTPEDAWRNAERCFEIRQARGVPPEELKGFSRKVPIEELVARYKAQVEKPA